MVVDTNVLFSAVAFPKDSPPLKILELARAGKIEAFVSPFILEELEKSLLRKTSWDEKLILALGKRLKTVLFLVEPKTRIAVIEKSEADNHILECAIDAKANVLVTGNMKDIRPLNFFRGIEILTPKEFLNKYFPDI